MPEEEIPHGDTIARMVGSIKPLNYIQKDMIIELFNNIEMAHQKMAHVCGRLSSLSKTLTPVQLVIILKATIRPMVQLNTTAQSLDILAESRKKVDLPENIGKMVKLTIIPDPDAAELKREHMTCTT